MNQVRSDLALDVAEELSGVMPYGLRMSTVSSALAPGLMRLRTAAAATVDIREKFSTLEEEVKNPPGTMKALRPCSVACFGVCVKNLRYRACNSVAKSIHSMLKSKQLHRDQLPVVFGLSVETAISFTKHSFSLTTLVQVKCSCSFK